MGDVVVLVLVAVAVLVLVKSVRIVGAGHVAVVERRGRYRATLQPGVAFLVPFLDRVRRSVDLGEHAVLVPAQPVITEDGYAVAIETVVFLQVTDPVVATYQGEQNTDQQVRQLATERLREVVGGMDRDQTLRSGEAIATWMRGVLDAALSRRGVRVGRVEVSGFEAWESGTTTHGI